MNNFFNNFGKIFSYNSEYAQFINNDIDDKNHKVTMMPIFFNASASIFAFFSFVLFEEMFMILKGENLSLFFIMMFKTYSVREFSAKFKFDVLPSKSIIFMKPESVK